MASWHEQMADAVAERKKAINGVNRWLEKRAAAEQKIEELSTLRTGAEPVSADAASATSVTTSPSLNPIFTVNQSE